MGRYIVETEDVKLRYLQDQSDWIKGHKWYLFEEKEWCIVTTAVLRDGPNSPAERLRVKDFRGHQIRYRGTKWPPQKPDKITAKVVQVYRPV
jgi:hypothetical protein